MIEAFVGQCKGFSFLNSCISENLCKQMVCVTVTQSLAFDWYFLISNLKDKRGHDIVTQS